MSDLKGATITHEPKNVRDEDIRRAVDEAQRVNFELRAFVTAHEDGDRGRPPRHADA